MGCRGRNGNTINLERNTASACAYPDVTFSIGHPPHPSRPPWLLERSSAVRQKAAHIDAQASERGQLRRRIVAAVRADGRMQGASQRVRVAVNKSCGLSSDLPGKHGPTVKGSALRVYRGVSLYLQIHTPVVEGRYISLPHQQLVAVYND